MILLFFLQLKSGQNPYQILGIPRDSDDQQIKSAYHKLARKYHPDVSKEKDAERKFIDATDAYELLKDKRRRQIFDQTGSVQDIPDEKEQKRSFQQFQNFQRQFFNVKLSTPYVDENSIDLALENRVDGLIMIYSSRYWGSCIDFAYFYEDIAKQYKYIIKFMRNDVTKSKAFINQAGIRSIPNVVYAYRNSKGQLSYMEMDKSIHDKSSFLSWMIHCWRFYIARIKSVEHAKKWIEKDPGLTHILSVSFERNPSIDMKRIATVYGFNCKFAILNAHNISYKELAQLNITNVPEYHVYRRNGNQIIDDLLIDAKNFVKPQFSRLKRKSQFFECRYFCIVYIGIPTNYQINRYISMIDEPLAYINYNSTFAKALKLKNTQWILFEGLKKRYAVIQNKENIPREISKYKNNGLLMKNLPSNLNIDLDLFDQFDDFVEYIDKIIQKLTDFPFYEAFSQISTEFIVSIFLVFMIFLFFCC